MTEAGKRRVIPIALARGSGPATGSGLKAPPPLALYVHWPWCVRKCPYCDFNSHEAAQIDEDAYLQTLIADLESALPAIWNRPVISIFIGGGTPSLMTGETVEALLTAIRMRLPLQPEAEITLEANPGTAEAARFAAYRAAGVNRLSLGIQSFNDSHLAALGRIHDGDSARRAIDCARQHFARVNLDLMYGLPGQTLAAAAADLRTALAFGVQHISAYQLTIEPNTAFHHRPPQLPDEELCADMQEMAEAELAAAGFEHYETSAFARPDERCRHNLNYWTFGDYLGIGAGAHSKLSDHTRIWRETRHKGPRSYFSGARLGTFALTQDSIRPDDLPAEFIMNALRLIPGVPLALFEERTGLPPSRLARGIAQAQTEGLLEADTTHLRPTPRGQRLLNRLLQNFLP